MPVLSAERVRRLSLGINAVDDIFPGFEAGDFGVLCGSEASAIGFALCVRCVIPDEMGGLGSKVVFIDGGNSFNPYLVAEITRGFGLDPRDVLDRIYVSRAFTAYQLSVLILEKLNIFLERCDAWLVYVSDIDRLFLDRDIPKTEAQYLFIKLCAALSELATKRGKVVLASYASDRSSRRGVFFDAVLLGRLNVLVKLERRGKILRFSLLDHPRLKPFTVEVPL